MNILIDIEKLEQDKIVTPEQAAELRRRAIQETGGTAINMLLAFGAIVVAAGFVILVPSAASVAFFSAAFVLLGFLIKRRNNRQWDKLAAIWMIIGALLFSGASATLLDSPLLGALISAAVLGVVAVLAQSGLLIALTPLSIAGAIGSSTGYWHASYSIMVREPTITIALFSVLGWMAWLLFGHLNAVEQLFGKLSAAHQRLAIIFARVCVIMVNFGFWTGSLWGDTPGDLWRYKGNSNLYPSYGAIPDVVFSFTWAAALIFAGLWGARNGRRFMVNTVATFGAIHFYTQWFEHLGAQPYAVIFAGLITIGIALGLWRYNRTQLGGS